MITAIPETGWQFLINNSGIMYLVKSPKIFNKITDSSVTWRMSQKNADLYLTFDDGPGPELTDEILDILREKNVPATFFCVGDNVRKYPETFRKIVDGGHTIGNHTYNHKNGWKTPNALYLSNIKKFDKHYSTRLFRPPYGRIKPSQIRRIKKDYQIIFWSLLSGDFDPDTSPGKCYNNVVNNLHNGAIIVFHDNLKAKNNMRIALPKVIDYAKKQNYRFRSL
ncbi:MAG: polysaccharide deacetylase family protein [Bacteroidota bacterium]